MTPADFNDAPGSVFQMGEPPSWVDISQKIEAVKFSDAWEHRIETFIAADIPTQVISADDIIKNKLAVARPQDLIDVERIREAAKAAKKSNP